MCNNKNYKCFAECAFSTLLAVIIVVASLTFATLLLVSLIIPPSGANINAFLFRLREGLFHGIDQLFGAHDEAGQTVGECVVGQLEQTVKQLFSEHAPLAQRGQIAVVGKVD